MRPLKVAQHYPPRERRHSMSTLVKVLVHDIPTIFPHRNYCDPDKNCLATRIGLTVPRVGRGYSSLLRGNVRLLGSHPIYLRSFPETAQRCFWLASRSDLDCIWMCSNNGCSLCAGCWPASR